MGLSFQRENGRAVVEEMLALFPVHWDEVGQDKTRMIPAPDFEFYFTLSDAGRLLVVTAREEGLLVGYHVSFLAQLAHYKYILGAHGDIYYLAKPYRKGLAGLKLFKQVEREAKALGVQVLYDITKLYLDNDVMFRRLGYKAIERKYSKWIGD